MLRWIILLTGIILSSCANIKPPTGGEKDIDGPIMIKTLPKNKSTNFKSDRVVLFFNEAVETKNLKQEIIITPDDNISFKEIPRKNSITLKFKDTLRSNTTYNINFGSGIVDITERNPCLNAKIAFSTGDKIDTAFIKGKVFDMWTQKPAKDVIAILHPINDTIDVQKHKPAYLARVDEDGFFKIENLKQDSFELYAIQDKNGNLVYNPGSEQISRFIERVTSDYVDTTYSMYLSNQDTRRPQIISIKNNFNYSEINLNKGLYSYAIDNDTLYNIVSKQGKSISIFHPFSISDSMSIGLTIVDSSNYTLDSLVYIKTIADKDTLHPEFVAVNYPPSGKIHKLPDTIFFKTPFPFQKVNIDTVFIIKNKTDSLIQPITINLIDSRSFSIINPFPKAESISLRFMNTPVISRYNDSIKSILINYTIPDEQKFGQIDGKIISVQTNLIIQLINLKGETIEQMILDNNEFSFKYVTPGSYKLRAIIDSNNNGKYDSGDHYLGIQPEQVKILDEEILLKANWIVQDKIIEI